MDFAKVTSAKEENQISNKGCKNVRFGMRMLEHSFKILISVQLKPAVSS